MKKIVLPLVFAFIPAWIAWGAEFSLSAGGGGLLAMDITRYTLSGQGDGGIPDTRIKVQQIQDITQFNYGGFLFLDASWVEFTLTFQGGLNSYSEITDITMSVGEPSSMESAGAGRETALGLSLLGKYPFRVSQRVSLFPLAGIEYRIALMEWRKPNGGYGHYRDEGYHPSDQDKDKNPHKLSAWNALWIHIGGGIDYALAPSLYLRGELLYGFRLMTSYEIDGLDQIRLMLNDQNPRLAGLTSGPALKIALGYRFF